MISLPIRPTINGNTVQPLYADRMLLPDGWAKNVTLKLDNAGFITGVETDTEPGNAERLAGPVIPGMVNVHSHAFQRLIAGYTDIAENPDDSFWTWREAMYRAALTLDPEQFGLVARHVFVEMLRAGFTSVGEFHYVHHQPDGTPHERRAELAERVVAAAGESSIALSMLPVLYSHAGFGGQPPSAGQRRFINDVEGFLALHEQAGEAIRELPTGSIGLAFHSLRAVTGEQIHTVLDSVPRDMPIHIHVAEQQREVEDCVAWSRQRPVAWLLDHAAVDARWCLIHATHLDDDELARVAESEAVVGLCPVTEGNLGDGLSRASEMIERDMPVAIGSDSHVSLSVVEELRWLEYGQRLATQRRNRLGHARNPSVGEHLYATATHAGAQAIGQPVGRIAEGLRADLVVLDEHHPLLADCPQRHMLNRWLFGVGDAGVRDVWVAGRRVVADGHHPLEEASGEAFRQVCREVVYS